MSDTEPAMPPRSSPRLHTNHGDAPLANATLESALTNVYRKIQPYELYVVIGAAMAILIPGIWAYTLIDPWETHYAEVGRRILEANDWVHLKAEDRSFRSKPVFTPWLIAGSMQLFGVATDGGYSGELATNGPWVNFVVRLPFTLFAVLGVTMIWTMLAQLVNRRAAWFTFVILVTSPFYCLVARQSITDMPMVGTFMAAMACFALAAHAGDVPIRPFWRGVSGLHVFLAIMILIVGGQLAYYFVYFLKIHPGTAPGVTLNPGLLLWPLSLGVVGWIASLHPRLSMAATTRRQVYMFWFYLLIGLTVLAKGPPGIALAGLICLLFILITADAKLLFKIELVRGALLTALVSLPWHCAMYLKDGPSWYYTYIHVHMLNRFAVGVHGDRGTFTYFASQLGIGMWPWIALLPAALASVLYTARRDNVEGRLRLLIGIWAIAGYATFCISETKFHHYVLPVVPALAILIGLWLDDLLRKRARCSPIVILLAIPIVGLIARDFVGEQKQLIELFIYKYTRPWPSVLPWQLDLSTALIAFGVAFSLIMLTLSIPRLRRYSVVALIGGSLVFGLWTMNVYMPAAGPHWGQQALHNTYYHQRAIYGVDFQYYSLRNLADDWQESGDVHIESALPNGFAPGAAMTIQIFVRGAGTKEDRIELSGSVSRVGDQQFWIAIPETERSKLLALITQGQSQHHSRQATWKQVNADRMIAWQLNWHGEDFWTGGEMYGDRADAKTIFKEVDNKRFLTWLKDPKRAGRTYFLITESGRVKNLRTVLPTPLAKESLTVVDTSSNKFTLVRFSM